MSEATDDPATVAAILQHAPRCVECGHQIDHWQDAERVRRTFRLRHIGGKCPTPRRPEAA